MYYMFTCMEGKTAHIVIIAGNFRGWSRFMYKMAYIKVTFWVRDRAVPDFSPIAHNTPYTDRCLNASQVYMRSTQELQHTTWAQLTYDTILRQL